MSMLQLASDETTNPYCDLPVVVAIAMLMVVVPRFLCRDDFRYAIKVLTVLLLMLRFAILTIAGLQADALISYIPRNGS